MGCCHYFAPTEGGDTAFSVDVSAITFGNGCLAEAGDHARALGIRRIALLTDKRPATLGHVDVVRRSLDAAGVGIAYFDEVHIEPTNHSVQDAARFAQEAGSTASSRSAAAR